jgi:hypothetical protein
VTIVSSLLIFLGIKQSPIIRMLINFQKEIHHVMVLTTLNIESTPPQIKILKEIPCAASIFLGDQDLLNPPVFILGEDRQTFILLIDEPSKLDAKTKELININEAVKDNLQIKIKNIFWTPFRNGYVILYHTLYDNLLRFSNNRLESNDILDLSILNSNYVFKTQYDENIFDIVWQVRKTKLRYNLLAKVLIL